MTSLVVATPIGSGTSVSISTTSSPKVTIGASTSTASVVIQQVVATAGSGAVSPNFFDAVNTSPVTLTRGMPARIQTLDGSIKRARAMGTPDGVRRVAGMVVATTPVGQVSTVQTSGRFESTVAEWSAITGEAGGLVPGALYYLSADFGLISRFAPSTVLYLNPWLIEIGSAISTTVLIVNIDVIMPLWST